jgi:hypothetical protein
MRRVSLTRRVSAATAAARSSRSVSAACSERMRGGGAAGGGPGRSPRGGSRASPGRAPAGARRGRAQSPACPPPPAAAGSPVRTGACFAPASMPSQARLARLPSLGGWHTRDGAAHGAPGGASKHQACRASSLQHAAPSRDTRKRTQSRVLLHSMRRPPRVKSRRAPASPPRGWCRRARPGTGAPRGASSTARPPRAPRPARRPRRRRRAAPAARSA